ncbi:conjugal transfer protein TrbF [Klebsiella pneumoniae subsp. pneumoniae]|uniref:F-type conjugal transfer protein TrbF n=1 Tax=Klebsiella pneumoniae TaxID=573 RepID=UPI000B952608|nr:F-type conjugal transfer protein TrbF [Klebsiella pneumoniae]OYM16834.1 conjugal transfer protein TrbF [Klebsiella pneumoniae subsp. pneumoniae]
MNKYIRSTGLYAFLFPASLKAPGQTAAEKIEQLKPEFIHRERRLEIYLELFIVFLTAGALLLWIMRFLFNLCVDDWIASGDLRVKDLWNIMMYAIPYALIAVGVGFFVAGVILANRNFFSYHLKTLFILRNDRVKKNAVRNGGQDAN